MLDIINYMHGEAAKDFRASDACSALQYGVIALNKIAGQLGTIYTYMIVFG